MGRGFPRRFPVKKTTAEGEAKPKPSKWKNKKVGLDGMVFDSQAEADCYLRLKADPDVLHLIVHPTFLLVPAYRDPFTGVLYRKVEYESDFIFTRKSTGLVYVHDVKGFALPDFKIKFKLAVQKYPHLVWQAHTKKGVDVFAPKTRKKKQKIA